MPGVISTSVPGAGLAQGSARHGRLQWLWILPGMRYTPHSSKVVARS